MERFQQLLTALANDPSAGSLLIGILLTLAAVVMLIVIFKLSNRFLQKVNTKLESWRGTRIPPVKIQTFELISADRLTEMLEALVRGVRLVVLIMVLYVFIPLVLSFFPRTRGLVSTYMEYIVAPFYTLFQGLIAFVPNLIFIAVVAVATRYILKFIGVLFAEIRKGTIAFPGFHLEWVEPTHKLLRFFIIVFAVVLISPYLPGFGSPAFQGISIFFGVLLSLGSTAAIANLVAGVALTYMRPFREGDRVRIADTMGDVIEKTLLITRVRTIKNVEVTIPNSMVLGSHMINFSALAGESGLILHTAVTIGYDVPWRKVHALLQDAADATRDVLKNPAPFVLQTSLNDFSVTYELNVYAGDARHLLRIQSELHQNIQDQFNAAGIEILSPTYAAIRDGNQTVLPDEYLPKGSAPKGFRVLK